MFVCIFFFLNQCFATVPAYILLYYTGTRGIIKTVINIKKKKKKPSVLYV